MSLINEMLILDGRIVLNRLLDKEDKPEIAFQKEFMITINDYAGYTEYLLEFYDDEVTKEVLTSYGDVWFNDYQKIKCLNKMVMLHGDEKFLNKLKETEKSYFKNLKFEALCDSKDGKVVLVYTQY